jgi:lysozyme family protein
MSAPSYGAAWPAYAKQWDKCSIVAKHVTEVKNTAAKLFKNKDRYNALATKTGVPWWVIAALHERESGARFDRQLAQGDPLNRRSTNEPISGPFSSFEDSAVWALHHDHLDTVTDWRVEKCLYWSEAWNGWGYRGRVPSPYLWGDTTIQQPGKFIRDHVWSSTAWDEQEGVAAIWKGLAMLDPTIKFVRETPAGTPGDEGAPVDPPLPKNQVDTSQKVKVVAPPKPTVVTPPAKTGGFWSWLTRTK